MKHRLWLPDLGGPATTLEPGTAVTLDPDQAHYVGRVLRLRAGAELGLFDGRGNEWRAALVRVSARDAVAEILAHHRDEGPPEPLVLAQGWLKGNAMDTVVQKAVELGATGIWLLRTDRSNVKLDERRRAGKLTHLNRVIVSAAEQCETLWLPELVMCGGLADALARSRPGLTLFLDPGGPPLDAGGSPAPVTVLIGPEGGWSDAERALAAADPSVVPAGLGALILRAETAPLAVLAAIRQGWGWRR